MPFVTRKSKNFSKKLQAPCAEAEIPGGKGCCFSGKCRAAFRDFAHALQNFVSPNSAAAWQNAEISMRFPRIYARLAEFSTSTAEISKRLVNFCSPKARFLDIVSAKKCLWSRYFVLPRMNLAAARTSFGKFRMLIFKLFARLSLSLHPNWETSVVDEAGKFDFRNIQNKNNGRQQIA